MQGLEDITVLGIETSCDETSAAVVKNGRHVMSNVISSQVDLHGKYGGVVPEIASRRHVELIIPVIDQALKEAAIDTAGIDVIGVTCGPGLAGALLVGLSAAKSMAFALGKPLIGVHHIAGHIAANYIECPELEPPFICLVVSGGHSHIVCVKDYNEFEVIGQTRDDAAGEAFDKIARALGLGYPGGPAVDKIARTGSVNSVCLPRVRMSDGSLDFSFSGLKTAALNYINSMGQKGAGYSLEDFCASFQQAVVDVLVSNTVEAARRKGMKKIALAGGVAANSALRAGMKDAATGMGFEFFCPKPVLCTDNAAMIACAAYYNFLKGMKSDLSLNASANLALAEDRIACG